MKSLRSKLLLSILTVALTFIALGSTAFAWFSMNKTVSATGMNITANSDTTYLLISKTKVLDADPTAAQIQAENDGKGNITVDLATGTATSLYPTAHGTVGEAPDYTVAPITAGAGVTDFSWYTMNGTNAANGAGAAQTARAVANGDITKYVLQYDLYFTVADGANAAKDLVVSSCTIAGDDAVKCLVVGTNSVEFAATDADGDATVLAATLTDDAVVKVTVYVYYDGTVGTVTTNEYESAQILPTTISLNFTCKEATEA